MKLRFLRAKYSKTALQNATKHQYLWDYFPEAMITVQFVEHPAGSLAQSSTDERPKKADELLDLINGQKYLARTFVDGDVWYVLYAQPRTSDAVHLIDKLFDSFKFVKK